MCQCALSALSFAGFGVAVGKKRKITITPHGFNWRCIQLNEGK